MTFVRSKRIINPKILISFLQLMRHRVINMAQGSTTLFYYSVKIAIGSTSEEYVPIPAIFFAHISLKEKAGGTLVMLVSSRYTLESITADVSWG